MGEAAFKVTGMDVSGYMVKDAKRAMAFYRDVLGLEPSLVYPEDAGAEYELAASAGIDAIQFPEPGDVDHSVRRFDVELHQIVERSATGQEARSGPADHDGANGLFRGARAHIAEGLHPQVLRILAAASSIAATMLT